VREIDIKSPKLVRIFLNIIYFVTIKDNKIYIIKNKIRCKDKKSLKS
jgi:hypothetical protein